VPKLIPFNHAAISGKEQSEPTAAMWSSLSGHHSCGGGSIPHQIGLSQPSYRSPQDGCGCHVGYFGLQGRKISRSSESSVLVQQILKLTKLVL